MESFKRVFCSTILIFAIYSVNGSPVQEFGKGMSAFANDLYLQCVKEKPGNLIVSPLSVETALALLSQGAGGNTFEQLKAGLHFGGDKTALAKQFIEHREALQKNLGNSSLSIANRIYIQQGHQLNKNFQDVAVSKFKSGVESLNFGETEKSAETINNFVKEETNGKIKELIKPDQLDANTRSVLVNAIYFKANWEQQFPSEFTQKLDFYNSETETVSTDFLFIDSGFNVASLDDLGATALEMKYENSNVSFVIVLPESRTGLAALEAKLKDYDLAKLTEKLELERYEVYIPKFKIEYEIKLNDVLKNLGITDIFADNANLRELLESDEQLKVSDVVHKAFIEVNEKGTEAGAATGSTVVAYSMPPEFRADHPFMFFIRDTETNTIIFSGRIEQF